MGSPQVLRADGGGWKVGISLAGLRGLAVSRYVLAPCWYVVCSGAGGRAGVINWAVLEGGNRVRTQGCGCGCPGLYGIGDGREEPLLLLAGAREAEERF